MGHMAVYQMLSAREYCPPSNGVTLLSASCGEVSLLAKKLRENGEMYLLLTEEMQFLAASLGREIKSTSTRGYAQIKKYCRAMGTLHTLISRKGDRDSEFRFWQHQAATEELLQEARVQATLGFFPIGLSTRESQFGTYPETISDRFIHLGVMGLSELQIGIGPQFLLKKVFATFDTSQSCDWGWSDSFGTHVEYYDSTRREYVRDSMTGAHSYVLRIDSNGLCTPMPR